MIAAGKSRTTMRFTTAWLWRVLINAAFSAAGNSSIELAERKNILSTLQFLVVHRVQTRLLLLVSAIQLSTARV